MKNYATVAVIPEVGTDQANRARSFFVNFIIFFTLSSAVFFVPKIQYELSHDWQKKKKSAEKLTSA